MCVLAIERFTMAQKPSMVFVCTEPRTYSLAAWHELTTNGAANSGQRIRQRKKRLSHPQAEAREALRLARRRGLGSAGR